MKHFYVTAFTIPLLAACNQNTASPPLASSVSVPAVAPPAGQAVPPGKTSTSPASPAISLGNMPAYCRGEASAFFAVKPAYIITGAYSRVPGGGYSIQGTADQGVDGKKPFRCNFDAAGRMGPIESLVNEGKL